MLGYKYNTEQEAINAQTLCDNAYGYPLQDATTSHWVDYQFSTTDSFYFIAFNESIREILGEPIEFEVTIIITI